MQGAQVETPRAGGKLGDPRARCADTLLEMEVRRPVVVKYL